ncbi:hypothetical protein CDL12_01779 [Handroanthus impetiginosus]|uniref:Uncharacterized protein n=1 Tax=Handroanthus impetiginosus TaxID=429701 RepID=A0A2G9I771_9LAMI|nr:hypothetical protein CDL12_01779 [Handroanthus impetiginosus]
MVENLTTRHFFLHFFEFFLLDPAADNYKVKIARIRPHLPHVFSCYWLKDNVHIIISHVQILSPVLHNIKKKYIEK